MKSIVPIILILLISITIVSGSIEPTKNTEHGEGGLPNNQFIDMIRNAFGLLSITVACPSGYIYCYEETNVYGDAGARATIYLSDPYVEGGNLYINTKWIGTKLYVYRGITSWDSIVCNEDGCTGGTELTGSEIQYLLGSAPTTIQPSAVFVAWDYDSYNGYWTWTQVSHGWLLPFEYNLNPTPPPTPTPTATPLPSIPVTATIRQGSGMMALVTSYSPYIPHTTTTNTGGVGIQISKLYYPNDKFGFIVEPSTGYKLSKVCIVADCSIVVPYYAYINSPVSFDVYFELLPTPTPTATTPLPTPTQPAVAYSLSISKPSYLIGETVTINACVDSTGGHLITTRPDGGLMYDWQLPVAKCSIANYPTSTTFMRGTYTVKLTDMSNTVKFQNSFQLVDASTPTPTPTSTGSLSLYLYDGVTSSQINGASVFVDGIEKGQTLNGNFQLNGVVSGTHNIKISKIGYSGYKYCINSGCTNKILSGTDGFDVTIPVMNTVIVRVWLVSSSTPNPISTPPSPSIQPPTINTMINALASFLKTLFPFLPW